MTWNPEVGKPARVKDAAYVQPSLLRSKPVLVVHLVDGLFCQANTEFGLAAFHLDDLEPWEPRAYEHVRVLNPEVLQPACPITKDPDHEVVYLGQYANPARCPHRVQRIHGTRNVYGLKANVMFGPVIPSAKRQEQEEVKSPDTKVPAKEAPTCVWCKRFSSHEPLCDKLQETHTERLKAGGVDTEYTREETRRFVVRQAQDLAGASTAFLRTSDRAGLDSSANARKDEPLEETPTRPLFWEAWSTSAWDFPDNS